MIYKFKSVEESWFNVCTHIMQRGYEYEIQRGSFKGQKRKQLPYLAFVIEKPHKFPLYVYHKGVYLTTDTQIENYFTNYLMKPTSAQNETYSYGSRITPHLNYLVEMLKDNPGTNQGVIEVGRPKDIILPDPPCLRSLSWKYVKGKLNLTSYWRSWDIQNALPLNLGGLTLLNNYVSEMSGHEPGDLICFSDGAHVYTHLIKHMF